MDNIIVTSKFNTNSIIYIVAVSSILNKRHFMKLILIYEYIIYDSQHILFNRDLYYTYNYGKFSTLGTRGLWLPWDSLVSVI